MNTMRAPTSLSEWQLQAVLHRANLPKYYDVFIEQGGDDIDQFIQCDEKEFLEIMRLVGMTSKPLHVRRFQNTLRELSTDREAFFRLARQQIGPPPISAFPSCSTATSTGNDPSSALHLLSALLPATISGSPSFGNSLSHANTTPSIAVSSTIGATANVQTGEFLMSMIGLQQQPTGPTQTISSVLASQSLSGASPASEGYDGYPLSADLDTNGQYAQDMSALSNEDIAKLRAFCAETINHVPAYQLKLVQNKKKISQELLDVIKMPPTQPERITLVRKYSAIYGRFDTKRKPDKPLTHHEMLVNEACAQLCLLQPALLTRRDDLFTLARKVVREADFPHVKSLPRKRPYDTKSDRSHSPHSSISSSCSPAPEDINFPSDLCSSSGDNKEEQLEDNENVSEKRLKMFDEPLNDMIREQPIRTMVRTWRTDLISKTHLEADFTTRTTININKKSLLLPKPSLFIQK
ncbi:hypothetical protein L596_000889 [Steinernema carpocapsae]|uniref:NAB co-repressor domain-containing protein n=1 Tax=Steinernema carpocapsae TaxID=34508 RepID=A0A4V6I775_STECR|nr:hypothetical protein L596_000889 [Steinernema carpocapsae]